MATPRPSFDGCRPCDRRSRRVAVVAAFAGYPAACSSATRLLVAPGRARRPIALGADRRRAVLGDPRRRRRDLRLRQGRRFDRNAVSTSASSTMIDRRSSSATASCQPSSSSIAGVLAIYLTLRRTAHHRHEPPCCPSSSRIGLYVPFLPFAGARLDRAGRARPTTRSDMAAPTRAPERGARPQPPAAAARGPRDLPRRPRGGARASTTRRSATSNAGEYAPSLHLALRMARFFDLPVEADLLHRTVRAARGPTRSWLDPTRIGR